MTFWHPGAFPGFWAGAGDTPPSYIGLLDLVPGAVAAHDLRLLKSDYAGPAIRVRRSGDSAETDIGFDENGDLDVTALLAHCGGADGFITTWYDQSGNGNDLTQTVSSSQPFIVLSGVVNRENGKPAIGFDGVNDILAYTGTGLDLARNTGAMSAVGVWKAANTGTDQHLFALSTTTNFARCRVTKNASGNLDAMGGRRQDADSFTQITANSAMGTSCTITSAIFDYTNTDAYLYRNGALVASNTSFLTAGSTSDTASMTCRVGGAFNGVQFLQGNIASLIFYRIALSGAQREALEDGQSAYYAPTLALELVAGGSAAYGLRKLRAAYTGSAIRVRRSSDSVEADIGFDDMGNLNITALLAHCGAGSGFIRTWYDQSGNGRDIEQATTSAQPRLVNAGALEVKNSMPAVYFGGAAFLFRDAPFMFDAGASSLSMAISLTAQTNRYIVSERDTASVNSIYGLARQDSTTGANCMTIMRNTANSVFLSTTGSVVAFDGNLKHLAVVDAGNNIAQFVNGASALSGSYTRTGSLTLTRFTVGCSSSTSNVDFITGHIAELLIYPTALSAGDRGTLQADEATYFAIS